MKFALTFVSILIFSLKSHSLPSEGQKIMISAPSQLAVNAGLETFKSGGNIIDVATAVGLTLTVTNPYNASLGGGGFAVIHFNGKTTTLDFRETAPIKTNEDFFSTKKKDASRQGPFSIGIPGTLAGYKALHKKYGKKKWSSLFKVPMQVARNGFPINSKWRKSLSENNHRFGPNTKRFFSKPDGKMLVSGDTIRQNGLYQALKLIKKSGAKPFYQGVIAKDIVDTIQSSGGIISLDDLKKYKVRWLDPIKTNYQDHEILMMPPPSSGGIIIATALKLIERQNLKSFPPISSIETHLWGEILSRSFRARGLLADPDFHKNPIEKILSKKYIDTVNKTINISETVALAPLKSASELPESEETTHFSIIDKKGNAVSITITLNSGFGSGLTSKKFGITLNNEMDDFTTTPNKPNQFGLVQGSENQIQPGKRPLSSMTPTIVLKNNKAIMSLGAPGGPTIISSIAQVLYRVLVNKYNMEQAIHTPRVHHQFLPNTLFLDSKMWSPDVISHLKLKGHTTKWRTVGRVFGVRKNKDGLLEGATDPRGEGFSGGL